jgi:hypothetical protein
MAQLPNIKVPDIDTGQLNNTKYAKQILDYLMTLDESLRYMFGHLDDENVTSQFIEDLTVGNINITNGENSIIGNATDGFIFLKGTKPVLKLDINTGSGEFKGDIIGSLMRSSNYAENTDGNVTSGMKIDLTDGSIKTTGFKYLDGLLDVINGIFRGTLLATTMRSEWQSGDSKYVLIIDESIFGIEYYSSGELISYVRMTDRGTESVDNLFKKYSGYKNDGIEITDEFGFVVKLNSDVFQYKGSTVLTEGNKDNYTFKTSGYTGSFMTATGKTATVVNGLITSIV